MKKKISYEEMVDQYYPIIFGYILKKITIWEDAEDLTQDIFLNCHKDWACYDPSLSSITTWLFAITNNRLKNYYRDRKSNVSLHDMDQSVVTEEGDPIEDVIDHLDNLKTFRDVTVCLNDRQKKAIHYRYKEQLKMAEVAEKLGCSEENARVIVHRAIKKMKNYAEGRMKN